MTSQTLIEGRKFKEVNCWRMNAFATFSAAYLGCGQHFVYNVWFLKWFGEGGTKPAVQKVV